MTLFFSQVLQHILDPYDFFNKVGSMLAQGGILHIDVPNHNSLTSFLRKINIFSDDFRFSQPPHHLVAYTKQSLSLLLQKSNFDLVKIDASANNYKTFGQLLMNNSIKNKVFLKKSSIVNGGSLLVAIVKRQA
jgi:hypothetical protein